MLRPKLFIPLYNGARAALVAGSHGAQTGVPPYPPAEPDLGSALPNSQKAHAHPRDAGPAQPDSGYHHQGPASDYGATSAVLPDASGAEAGCPGLDGQCAVQSAQWHQQGGAAPAYRQAHADEEQRGPGGASGAAFPAPHPGPAGPDAGPHLAFATPLRAILQPGLPAAGSGTPPAHLVARSLYPPHVLPLPFHIPSPSPLDTSLPRASSNSSVSPGVPPPPPSQAPAVTSHANLGHTEGVSPWGPSQAALERASAAPGNTNDSSLPSLHARGAGFAGQEERWVPGGATRQSSGAASPAPERNASTDAAATGQGNPSFSSWSHLHERAAPVSSHSWAVPPPLAPLPIPTTGPQHGGRHMGPGSMQAAAGQTETSFHRHVGFGAPGEGPWRTSPLVASSLVGGGASLPHLAAASAGVRAYHLVPGELSRTPMPGAPLVHRLPEVRPTGPSQVSKSSIREDLAKLTRGQPGAPAVVTRPLSPPLGQTPDLADLPLTLHAPASSLIPDVLVPAQDASTPFLAESPLALDLPGIETGARCSAAGQASAGRQGAPAEGITSDATDMAAVGGPMDMSAVEGPVEKSAVEGPVEKSVPEGVVKPHKPRHRGKRGGRNKSMHAKGPRPAPTPAPASSEPTSPLALPLSGTPRGTAASGTPLGDPSAAQLGGQQRKGLHGQARGDGADPTKNRNAGSAPGRVGGMRVWKTLESCLQRLHTSALQADPSVGGLTPEECAAILQREWERAWGPRYATSGAGAGQGLLSRLPEEGQAPGAPDSAAAARPRLSQRRAGGKEQVCVAAWHISEALKGVDKLAVAQGLMQWSEQHQKVKCDAQLYSMYIAAVAKCGGVEALEELHEMVRRKAIPISSWTYSRLINSYRDLNREDKALEVFEEAKASGERLECSVFSSVMTIHNRAGRYTKAAETFEEMAAWGVKPDRVAYTVMITAYARLGDKFSARRVKEEFCQQGMQPDVGLMNALMHAHGKAGDYKEARRIFQQMRDEGLAPNRTSFTIAIDIASKQGLPWEAEELFEELEKLEAPMDAIVWGSMLQMFGRLGDLRKVKEWFRRMLRSGCQPMVSTFNAVLFPLINLGLYEEASLLVDWMLRQGHIPSLMTYALFLSRLTQAQSRDEAQTMLRLMAKTRSAGHQIMSLLLTPPEGTPCPPGSPPAMAGGWTIWDGTASLRAVGSEENCSIGGLSLEGSSSRSSSSQEIGAAEGGPWGGEGSCDGASVTSGGADLHEGGGSVWGGGAVSEEAKWARVEQIMDGGIVTAPENRRPIDVVEERRCFADASINFLAKFGLHASGLRLWNLFLARDTYDGAARVRPQDWKYGTCEVDFHCMSMGTAQLVLKWTLKELRRTRDVQGVCPDYLVLITGWGKRSRAPGVPLVKQAIEQTLRAYGIPFSDGGGVFSVARADLEWWLDNPVCTGLPDVQDDWTS